MKNLLQEIWQKLRTELPRIWRNFGPAGQRTFGIILLCFVVLGSYAIYKNSHDKNTDQKLTIEDLHPDIGEALPPDIQPPPEKAGLKVAATVPENKGVVAGDNITQQNQVTTNNTNYLAPTTGAETLPFTVSSSDAATETLITINAELKLSPDVSEISPTTFDGNTALQFKTKRSGDGLVFIVNNKIFYLYGSRKDFSKFQLPR